MREKWIDNTKLIGIYLVVLGHFQLLPEFANGFIYAFHMPLFFFVSGIVHKPVKDIKPFVAKNFRQLILPYIYFYLITFLFQSALNFLSSDWESDGLIKILAGMVLGVGYSTSISVSINHPLWFLVALFLVRVFYGITENWFTEKKLPIAIIILIVVAATVFLKLNGIDLWFSLDSAALALPFYFFGILSKQWLNLGSIFKNRYISITAFLIFATLTFLLVQLNGAADINSTNWGNNIVLFYLAGITGTFMVIAVSFMFKLVDVGVLNTVAQNTIIIMCLQVVIKSFVFAAAKMAGYKIPQPTSLQQAALLSVIIIALSLIPVYIINRYFPFLTGKEKPTLKSFFIRRVKQT